VTGRNPRKRRARPWHRVLGLLLALPLVWVVLTGAVLNHTVDWKLDRIMIDHPWLLSAYGMVPKGEPSGMSAGNFHVAQWDGLVFVNGKAVDVSGRLLGALADGNGVAVVTDSQVLRIHEGGEVLETMDELSLPALPLTGVHASGGAMFLRNAGGWHRVEKDWLEFVKVEDDFEALHPEPLPPEMIPALRKAWSGGGLPLSRVLLDAHAGRFLGGFSKYFYDLVAVATLWLCATGVILFFRKPRPVR
jgi:uncharacterized iron-regulated membrane protein